MSDRLIRIVGTGVLPPLCIKLYLKQENDLNVHIQTMYFAVGLINRFELVLVWFTPFTCTVVTDMATTCFKDANMQAEGPGSSCRNCPIPGHWCCYLPLGIEDRQGHTTEGAVSFTAGKKIPFVFSPRKWVSQSQLIRFSFLNKNAF